MTDVHVFENGVRLKVAHILPLQLERYQAFRNVHEAEEEDVFVANVLNLRKNAIFVNIGAAVGYYVLLAKRLRPDLRVFAIEPLSLHRQYLHENCELNGIRAGEVTVLPEAIANRRGKALLVHRDFSSFVASESQSPSSEDKYSSPHAWTLRKLLRFIGGHIDLLQMDVQGLEYEILLSGKKGLTNGRCRTVILGTHGETLHVACRAMLRELGFTISVDIPNPTLQPDGVLCAQMADE